MNNKIDMIMVISDNSKHMIMDQGIYNGKNYFLTSMLDENGNLTNNLSIVEENVENGITMVETVKDEKLLNALIEYFKKRFEVNA